MKSEIKNLLPNGKFELWTISYIDGNENMIMLEPSSKEEVLEDLNQLERSGQDMIYVNVYPPKSNITYEELLTNEYDISK